MIGFLRRNSLPLLVVVYLAVGLSYALATPPLEASDEYKHYPVVQHVQTEGRLPVLDPDDPGRWLQEGAQPPLYYLVMAGLTSWIDTRDLPQLYRLNEHAFIGNPNQVGNKNLILHDPQLEAFPWQGSVLAIYVIRLASLLLGAGTVVLTARTGRLLFNRRAGLLAAAFTAFMPMFLFVNAAVNNDALAILLGHVGLILLLRLWQEVPDPRRHWHRYALLGLVLGLGLLTKLSLGGLLGLSVLALAWQARRQDDGRIFWLGSVLVLVPALALAAPWFLRNWALYGDPTAMNVFIAVQGTRSEPLTWADWSDEFGTFYRSFWGLFGGVNVAAPEWVYTLLNVTGLVAAAGLVRRLWRRRNMTAWVQSGRWLLLAWPFVLFLLLLRWNAISLAFQGRLIFPGLGALAILGAVGLLEWSPPRHLPRVAWVIALGLLLIAAVLPWSTIRPAYAAPQPLASVPEEARFGPFQFHAPDGEIQLVGVQVAPEQSVTPGGDPVQVTLFWQAVAPVSENYLGTVHLLGRDLTSVAAVSRHPAQGMVPTSRWEAGQIWRDDYRLYVGESAQAPARLQVRVGLYDPTTGEDLPMTGPSGESLSLLLVGDARLAAAPDAAAPRPDVAHEVALSDGITLLGYGLEPQAVQPEDVLQVRLIWRATERPARDYTVFVHLLNADGEQIVVADGPPVSGDYPTSFWREGDVLADLHEVALPEDLQPGRYRLAVGLYDPATGARLLRLDGEGDAIVLPVEVES